MPYAEGALLHIRQPATPWELGEGVVAGPSLPDPPTPSTFAVPKALAVEYSLKIIYTAILANSKLKF